MGILFRLQTEIRLNDTEVRVIVVALVAWSEYWNVNYAASLNPHLAGYKFHLVLPSDPNISDVLSHCRAELVFNTFLIDDPNLY